MESKPLVFGLIGFFLGGLIVSVAATTFDRPKLEPGSAVETMSMTAMTDNLAEKTGDAFDEAFIASMIEHHQGAVDMAELAQANAKHDEVKRLANEIIGAQQLEIAQMKRWQKDWGYKDVTTMRGNHDSH